MLVAVIFDFRNLQIHFDIRCLFRIIHLLKISLNRAGSYQLYTECILFSNITQFTIVTKINFNIEFQSMHEANIC